jgi:hypothetical protein
MQFVKQSLPERRTGKIDSGTFRTVSSGGSEKLKNVCKTEPGHHNTSIDEARDVREPPSFLKHHE